MSKFTGKILNFRNLVGKVFNFPVLLTRVNLVIFKTFIAMAKFQRNFTRAEENSFV